MGHHHRRRYLGLSAILVALMAAGAAAVQAQSVPTERITGSDGRYSLEMPKGYKHTTSPRPDGGTLEQFSFQWRSANNQVNEIELAVGEPPGGQVGGPSTDVSTRLRNAQRAIEGRFPGSVVSQVQDIQLGPARGRSFVITADSSRNQGQHVWATKIYAVDDSRIYEMIALTTVEDRDSPIVAAFMNSLQIGR